MSDEIKVHVIDYGEGRNLMLRYLDPVTGKHVAKSAKTRNKSQADKAAGVWEDELRSGRYQKPNRMTWEAFKQFYQENALPALAKSSIGSYEGALNMFERLATPQKLSDVTTARVTAFVTALRTSGRSESTIACHLRHLKAAMRWAHKQGLLVTLPQFTMPKRVKGAKSMRGRPITGEEFDRMLKAVPKAVENAAAKSWEFYLRGLWESGLRLSESLLLRWDDTPGAIVVDFTHKRPMLRIPGEAQKSGRDTLLPMTPDFAKLLASVPERQRRGRVFKLLGIAGKPLHGKRWVVGKVVSAIGKEAGIVVDERTKGKETVRKFASAHDLRRSFGQRWAGRVMPTVLRELMRHSEIGTTMKFYVGTNAEATAETLWELGNTLGNTRQTGKTSNSKNPLNSSTGERT